jgi:hypothetical protein
MENWLSTIYTSLTHEPTDRQHFRMFATVRWLAHHFAVLKAAAVVNVDRDSGDSSDSGDLINKILVYFYFCQFC